MKIIGITGGIASGKSTVSNIIKGSGYKIIDADIISREIVEKGKPALQEIVDSFGKEILNEDGSLNRKYLGSIVFSAPSKLKKLNEITHKRIVETIHKEVTYHKKVGKEKILFLDAALLIELNIQNIVDEVWLVSVDKNVQIQRLMDRNNISRKEAINRIDSQMSLEEKKKYADVIIDNSKDLEHLKSQINRLVYTLNGGA